MAQKGNYILNPNLELVGYEKLPFALYDAKTHKTKFFNKDQFDILYDCDGQTLLNPETMTDNQKGFFEFLLARGHIVKAMPGQELSERQRYKKYNNRYKSRVHWSITGDCNYRCKHCFMSAPDAKFGHPTKEQLLNLVEQMEECGIRDIDLTGGEPLIREDFFELVDAIKDHGMSIVGIITNGALVTEELLEGLLKRGMRPSFQMSFDGIGHHDWMRGVPGAEEKVLDAFRLLKKHGFLSSSSMALHRDSVGTIRESVNLLASVGCGSLKVNPASPAGEWLKHPDKFLSFEETLPYFLEYIPQYFEDGMPVNIMLCGVFNCDIKQKRVGITYDKGDAKYPEKCSVCGALRPMVYISPEGNILPCQSMMSGPIFDDYPNVFDSSLREILSDSNYIRDVCSSVGDFINHNPECGACEYIKHCHGGCRATAVGDSGRDFLAPDPNTCLFYKNGWYDKFKSVIRKCAPEGIDVFLSEQK